MIPIRYSPFNVSTWILFCCRSWQFSCSVHYGQHSHLKDFRETQDGRHGRADFVAHVGQELALGLVAASASSLAFASSASLRLRSVIKRACCTF